MACKFVPNDSAREAFKKMTSSEYTGESISHALKNAMGEECYQRYGFALESHGDHTSVGILWNAGEMRYKFMQIDPIGIVYNLD